jgi:hypothetical protein
VNQASEKQNGYRSFQFPGTSELRNRMSFKLMNNINEIIVVEHTGKYLLHLQQSVDIDAPHYFSGEFAFVATVIPSQKNYAIRT